METKAWYVASMGSDPHNQGLVADENTGENIAVTYRAENAPIVAAAPEAIELLGEALEVLENMTSKDFWLRLKIERFLYGINR